MGLRAAPSNFSEGHIISLLMWSIYEIIHIFELRLLIKVKNDHRSKFSRWSLDFLRLLLSICLNWKIYWHGMIILHFNKSFIIKWGLASVHRQGKTNMANMQRSWSWPHSWSITHIYCLCRERFARLVTYSGAIYKNSGAVNVDWLLSSGDLMTN